MPVPTEYTLTTAEVADQLGYHLDTIARWADLGKLPCWRAPIKGGHRRFRQSDVDAFRASLVSSAPEAS